MSARIWNPGLPDSETTVLVRLLSEEDPIIIGWHDGHQWRACDASPICGGVVGWAHLEDAALLLDGKGGAL